MKHYKVWVHVEEIDEERDHYVDLEPCYSPGCFDSEQAARDYAEDELMTTQITGSAVLLLETCKDLTSFVSELLYQMNDQVDLDEYEQIRRTKEAIDCYRPVKTPSSQQFVMTLQEQAPEYPDKSIELSLLSENGQLWIRPAGYGEKCTADGEGSPVGLEIWQGRLRLVVFDNINSEDPRIIDLEKARESCRYCKAAEYIAEQAKTIFTGHMQGGLWNARGLDAAILSRKQDDKAAYEFLIRYGDQYAQTLSDEYKLVWQQIKDQAALMVNHG